MTALFDVRDGLLIPSELTRGGWDDVSQHGGPPAGALARAVERVPTLVPMLVVRFSIDLIRPVPLTPLRIDTDVSREGKKVQIVEASMSAEDVEVARAVAVRIRISDLDIQEPDTDRMPAPPESLEDLVWASHFGENPDLKRFHYDAVVIRSVAGSFLAPGAGVTWFRLRYPLVEGEIPSPFVVTATLSDLANGNAQALDPLRHAFINPDISLHLHRQAVGEWIGMKSRSFPHRTGIGMTDTDLYDRSGLIGKVIQSQVIDERH